MERSMLCGQANTSASHDGWDLIKRVRSSTCPPQLHALEASSLMAFSRRGGHAEPFLLSVRVHSTLSDATDSAITRTRRRLRAAVATLWLQRCVVFPATHTAFSHDRMSARLGREGCRRIPLYSASDLGVQSKGVTRGTATGISSGVRLENVSPFLMMSPTD